MITPATVTRFDFTSTDADVVREQLNAMFGADASVSPRRNQTWRFHIGAADAGSFGISTADNSVDLSFRMYGGDGLAVHSIRHGQVEFESEGTHHYGPGDVFLGTYPDSDQRGRSTGGVFDHVTISGQLLRSVADVPDAPLGVRSREPVPGAAERWRPVAQLVDQLLADPAAAQSPLLIDSVGRVAAAAALDLFPNTVTRGPIRSDSRDAHLATLRRAIAFIESNPDHDIGLSDIAQAASVTPRAVRVAFRRHRDTTPTAYLRRVRLDRARADLTTATPDGSDATVTITRIANRWGYLHLATFSSHYRDAYGELPGATLQR